MDKGGINHSFFLCVGKGYGGEIEVIQDQVVGVFKGVKGAVVKVCGVSRPEKNVDMVGEVREEAKPLLSVGSGFFISREGHVMTNASVAYDVARLWVEYKGEGYEANLVGYDPLTNLAILKLQELPEGGVPYLRLDERLELPEAGTMVLAVTCKLGMEPGPSLGMISGWNTEYFEEVLPTTHLRTNIPADGGEMGSPVFDLSGQLVGILMISLDEIHSSFVFPVRAALGVRDDLLFSGKVSYGYMGIEIDEVAMEETGDVVIGATMEDSPGRHAGIKEGDKLIEFNHHKIQKVSDLRNAAFYARPGQYLPMKVLREGKEVALTIRLREGPPENVEGALVSKVN